jgi:Tfp pilus assembly protein PilO
MISKERKPLEIKAVKKFTIGDLIIPVLSLVILVIMFFFVYIPMITETEEIKDRRKEVAEDKEKIELLIKSVNNIDANELRDDYAAVKSVIPKRLEVADFAYYIDDLAYEKGLELESLSASNSLSSVESVGGNVYTVTSPLSYSGDYEDIVEFLDEIQSYSSNLITVSNISLDRESDDKWALELAIQGYYIEEGESVGRTPVERRKLIYAPFASYKKRSATLESIKARNSLTD